MWILSIAQFVNALFYVTLVLAAMMLISLAYVIFGMLFKAAVPILIKLFEPAKLTTLQKPKKDIPIIVVTDFGNAYGNNEVDRIVHAYFKRMETSHPYKEQILATFEHNSRQTSPKPSLPKPLMDINEATAARKKTDAGDGGFQLVVRPVNDYSITQDGHKTMLYREEPTCSTSTTYVKYVPDPVPNENPVLTFKRKKNRVPKCFRRLCCFKGQ